MRAAARKFPVAGALALTLVTALPAASAEEGPPDCETTDMPLEQIFCAQVEAQVADIILDNLMPKMVEQARERDKKLADLFKSLGSQTTVDLLEESQFAWRAYRDTRCKYDGYAVFGGTNQPLIENRCRARLTNERVKALEARLRGELPEGVE